MIRPVSYQLSPDSDETGINRDSYKEYPTDDEPVDSSYAESPDPDESGKVLYPGSHADNYDPEHTPDRNVPDDGPSGENTTNGGERGGGLWTSGGTVTSGSGYNDDDV
ncbi:hypothetical protein DYU11_22150 [Fibrisoma montanum]|uniref:Uncharacterized protein n=1 Tax=Fibrisoma montanum TaxID=2305895 RepID=A0A418M4J8_9BACT|nr:hypothetical protein [Fibrisoma montanum]RIV20735.1 hypothetical protein DYU11_22150 [Fibrisoma montanum]